MSDAPLAPDIVFVERPLARAELKRLVDAHFEDMAQGTSVCRACST